MAEQTTCPRRMGEMGPWERQEELDTWEPDRWTLDEAQDRAEQAEWIAKHGTNPASRMWPGETVPRTCSFCGGIHPEDAIELVRGGWQARDTTKRYKRYLQSPDGKEPAPPVKVYAQHFDREQIDRWNAAIAQSRSDT